MRIDGASGNARLHTQGRVTGAFAAIAAVPLAGTPPPRPVSSRAPSRMPGVSGTIQRDPACSKSHAGLAPAAAATVTDSATAAPHPPPTWECPRVLLRGHTAGTLPHVPGRSLNGADSVVASPEGRPVRRPNREPPSHVTRHQQRRGFILPSPPHTRLGHPVHASQPRGSHIRDQRELANRFSTPAALRPRQPDPSFRTSMFKHGLSPATPAHRPFYAALRHFGVVVARP